MYKSEKYNKTYTVTEIDKMYDFYLDYCLEKDIVPEYCKDEYSFLKKENNIPEKFLNNLVYHHEMIVFLNSLKNK